MPPLTLRVSTPADAEAVAALLSASYSTLLASHYDPDLFAVALPAMSRANPKLLACGTWYVVEDDAGELLGCGGWTPEHPNTGEVEPGVAHMRHFATHPDALRRGIARMIIERSLADASAQGVERVECFSTLPAERFYARFGFETLGRETIGQGALRDFPYVHMRRAAR